MSKIRVLLVGATAAGAFAAASFIPVHAQDVPTPIGTLSVDGSQGPPPAGHIIADGDPNNPGPSSGYIVAGNDGTGNADGVCADDNGSPGTHDDGNGNQVPNSTSQSCNQDIVTSQLPK